MPGGEGRRLDRCHGKGMEIFVEGWVGSNSKEVFLGLGQEQAQGVSAGMDGYKDSRVQGLNSREVEWGTGKE